MRNKYLAPLTIDPKLRTMKPASPAPDTKDANSLNDAKKNEIY